MLGFLITLADLGILAGGTIKQNYETEVNRDKANKNGSLTYYDGNNHECLAANGRRIRREINGDIIDYKTGKVYWSRAEYDKQIKIERRKSEIDEFYQTLKIAKQEGKLFVEGPDLNIDNFDNNKKYYYRVCDLLQCYSIPGTIYIQNGKRKDIFYSAMYDSNCLFYIDEEHKIKNDLLKHCYEYYVELIEYNNNILEKKINVPHSNANEMDLNELHDFVIKYNVPLTAMSFDEFKRKYEEEE